MDDVSSTVSDTPRLPVQHSVDELCRSVVEKRSQLGPLPAGWCWEEVVENKVRADRVGIVTTWRPVRLSSRGQPFATRFIPKRPDQG